MTGPSETAFLATMGASTAATMVGLYLANQRSRPGRPPRVRLGPTLSARSVGLTLVALLGGCAVVGLVAVLLHRYVGDAMLWWVALALIPVTLVPTLITAARATAADARGELRLDGAALVATWDGVERRWHLPDCTATLGLVPCAIEDADAALLLLLDGPAGLLPVTFPLVGIPGSRWLAALALPDGWLDLPGVAAFPAIEGVATSRALVEAVLAQVAAVRQG